MTENLQPEDDNVPSFYTQAHIYNEEVTLTIKRTNFFNFIYFLVLRAEGM